MLTGLGMAELPRGSEIRMDMTVVFFALMLSLLVGLVVGLAPVVSMRHLNLSQAFREESRSGTSGRSSRLVRRGLVASQVAFAFMLLVGAGLLFASFERVLAVEPGFVPANVLTARVSAPRSRYPGDPELRSFTARLLERVRALPGVSAAALSSSAPFGDDFSDSVILAEGYQMAPGESLISPNQVEVTPGYFETLGIDLRVGRTFTDGDTETAPAVVADHFAITEVINWDMPAIRLPDTAAVELFLRGRGLSQDVASRQADQWSTPMTVTKRGCLIWARQR